MIFQTINLSACSYKILADVLASMNKLFTSSISDLHNKMIVLIKLIN